MDKTLLLAVSFGTTYDETCEKNITKVEHQLQENFPYAVVRRAFTSKMIINALLKRGVAVDSVSAALKTAVNDGFTHVILQPTHLLYGDEYEKMCAQADEFRNKFAGFAIGKPLLADTCDLQQTAKAIADAFPPTEGKALVLMGHGTEHYVNPVYAAMQTVFRLMGRSDVFVGTVEAWPSLEEIRSQLIAYGCDEAVLAPLMLVAGDHATNDLAGDDEDSWKSVIEKSGMKTSAVLKGLGEYGGIRDIYVRHAKCAADELPAG